MFFKSRLKEIEKEILAIQRNDIADSESVGNSANIRKVKRKAEISALESERNFIVDRRNDRRNGWKQRLIWNVCVPIIVAIITAYIVAKYIGTQQVVG
ncbi:MAG: hypothetical protein AAB928_02200 [Patescibacteria group bacterium]